MTLLLKVEEQSNFKFVMSLGSKENSSFPSCQNVV